MATSQAPSKLEATCNLPSETLAVIISGILNDISDLSTSRGVSTRFHSRELLPISIQDYLGRIVKWLPASDDALLLMLLYLRRVALQLGSPLPPRYKPSRHARPVINHWTVHRLVLISLSLASKFISDYCFSQKRLVKVGGISAGEALSLEIELFIQLRFSLAYTSSELEIVTSAILQKQDGTFDVNDFVCPPADARHVSTEEDSASLRDLALTDLNIEPQVISPGWNNGFSKSPKMLESKPPSPGAESTNSSETVKNVALGHARQHYENQVQEDTEMHQG